MTGVSDHEGSRVVQVVIGVDTHQDQHVAVAVDRQGVRLAQRHAPASTCGYGELERWSRSLGSVHAFGVEGTGSYGAGLARFLTGMGHAVIEVNRPDRSTRYRKGKSDPTDAEMAARAVLAGVADAIPKSGQGEVEMIRMLKKAKDSALKARTQAVNQMKALVVTAPAKLRETLDGLTADALASRQELPPRPSGQSHSGRQVHSSLPCLSLPPAQQGDPQPGGRVGQTHPEGGAGPVKHLRCRTRHGCGPPDRGREQSPTPPQRGCLRLPVRGESHTRVFRKDQQAPAEPGRRPPSQCGALSHRSGQTSTRQPDQGIYEPPHWRGDE